MSKTITFSQPSPSSALASRPPRLSLLQQVLLVSLLSASSSSFLLWALFSPLPVSSLSSQPQPSSPCSPSVSRLYLPRQEPLGQQKPQLSSSPQPYALGRQALVHSCFQP